MDGSLLVAAGTMGLAGMACWESWWHRRRLESIPIRIHVNGTRGKSGVTRLIAAGLRAGGLRTCAKTTGTMPRMIFPDGKEYPVFRPSRANVIEQLRIVRAAAQEQADALVIECMALQPALQSLCELKIVRATHGVITNARADHLDVMGPAVADVARAFAGTVPVNGTLYTAEQSHRAIFEQAARDRHSQVVAINDDDVASVSWDELEQFPYIEHPDNVALALRVCGDLGVDRSTALLGMWQAAPDPGVMTVSPTGRARDASVFINGFAANDPDSTGRIWELVLQRYGQQRQRVAIINCRADRADRSRQLAEACCEWSPADNYFAIGSATQVFRNRALATGMDARRLTCLEQAPCEAIVRAMGGLSKRGALLMGMGNIAGPGMDLVQHFQQKSHCATTPKVPASSLRSRTIRQLRRAA